MKVMVIGGGIGGLCLAQGLKKAGVSVAVYERDESPESRAQGFRIHISPLGSIALHDCLPPELWSIFDATGGQFGQGFTLLSEQLKELLSFRGQAPAESDDIARHRSVSRITLRRILLHGLEQEVHFNKKFVRHEETGEGKFRAYFEDGSTAEGDVLVAADGVNSQVRRQYLPNAEPADTGVITLGGKIPLTDGVMALIPQQLLDGPALLLAPQPCSLFMAVWKREPERDEYLRRLGIDNGIAEDDDYVILGFGAKRDFYGLDPSTASGVQWKNVLRRTVARWNPSVRKLVEMLNEDELVPTRIRSSAPVAAWKATGVTLLGDAIHSMTPYRGIGANIALNDAAFLCARLIEAAHGTKPLLEAIAQYERAMRGYGFAAVAASLKSMENATAEKRVGFGVMKTAMRVVNAVPMLRRKLVLA
jgi:2-polyprenyl-6-methoxyphenol hydroxylase-like FAD-dependent oxidoreductase